MENAAEALRMAAGVILALLLVSLLIFTFSQIGSLENKKEEQEAIAQTSEFNNKFLAFDKTSMYGTDLISVLGLAISTNKIANQANTANPDGRYDENVDNSINVKFTLQNPVISTETRIVNFRENDGTITTNTDTIRTTTVLRAGTTYSLGVDDEQDKEILDILDKIAEGNTNISSKTTISADRRTTTTITNDISGFNDLKKAIFECIKVEQNGAGRINCMTFIEKEIN